MARNVLEVMRSGINYFVWPPSLLNISCGSSFFLWCKYQDQTQESDLDQDQISRSSIKYLDLVQESDSQKTLALDFWDDGAQAGDSQANLEPHMDSCQNMFMPLPNLTTVVLQGAACCYSARCYSMPFYYGHSEGLGVFGLVFFSKFTQTQTFNVKKTWGYGSSLFQLVSLLFTLLGRFKFQRMTGLRWQKLLVLQCDRDFKPHCKSWRTRKLNLKRRKWRLQFTSS